MKGNCWERFEIRFQRETFENFCETFVLECFVLLGVFSLSHHQVCPVDHDVHTLSARGTYLKHWPQLTRKSLYICLKVGYLILFKQINNNLHTVDSR